jgi:hypothetical protein
MDRSYANSYGIDSITARVDFCTSGYWEPGQCGTCPDPCGMDPGRKYCTRSHIAWLSDPLGISEIVAVTNDAE